MTRPTTSSGVPDAPCGPDEHIVLLGTLAATGEVLCISLQPGLFYGFHLGAPCQPPRIGFSTDATAVKGDHDWVAVDGTDSASLTLIHDGVTYTVDVTRTDPPRGTLTVAGPRSARYHLTPGSLLHDLPLA